MRMNIKIVVLVTGSIIVFSCNRADRSAKVEKMAAMEMASFDALPPPPPPNTLNDNGNFEPKSGLQNISDNHAIPDKKKIIKDGTIRIDIYNIKESKNKIDLIVARFDGYISNESFNDEYSNSEYTIKIRVPSVNFDSIIAIIERGNKNILSKSISARDVTEEFIDMETRLKNKKNYLIKYNDLLKQAKSVQDILGIEEKTRIIEEEIESTEGRFKYLNDLVSYSTLEVTLVLKKEYIENPVFKGNFFKRLGQAISSGWFGSIEFFIYLFRIWPLWIITFLTIYIINRIKKKRNKKE
jgi:hypothetical protein